MTTTQVVLLVVVLLVVVAVAAAVAARSRRRAQLQSRFGPEYDRTVSRAGGRRAAERELAERAERRRSLDIRPLPETDRLAYAERWRSAQADFVDRPAAAVRSADVLVTEVMGRRGYPVEDFEQMARDVSVDHAETVEQYRAAHEISELNDRHQASTEQLRQAMVHYRALFDDLLSDGRGTDDRTSSGMPSVADRDGDDGRVHGDRTEHRDSTWHDDGGRDDASRFGEGVTSGAPVGAGMTDQGYATDEDVRPDERAGRERVVVEREPVPTARIDAEGVALGRTDGGHVVQGGLGQEHGGLGRTGSEHGGQDSSGLGRGGFEPGGLVRGEVGHEGATDARGTDADRGLSGTDLPPEDRPRR